MEPIGEVRGDFRIALLCANVLAMIDGQRHAPAEFMPFAMPAPQREQSVERMRHMAEHLNRALRTTQAAHGHA